MVRLVLHPGATADITAAGDWYESQRAGLGIEFAADLDGALAVIRAAPSRWPLWPRVREELGVRRFVLTRFPFAVAYLVHSGEVTVLAVAHFRRRPGYWQRRLPR